jgi:hypothetical protein
MVKMNGTWTFVKAQFGFIILTLGLLAAVGWNISVSSPKVDKKFEEVSSQITAVNDSVTKLWQVVISGKESRIDLTERVERIEVEGTVPMRFRIEALEKRVNNSCDEAIRQTTRFESFQNEIRQGLSQQLTISATNTAKLDALKEQVRSSGDAFITHAKDTQTQR